MLTESQLIYAALVDCVDMLGEELVAQHKDLCCASYGFQNNGVFSYCLGMDTTQNILPIGDETPMQYYAFVTVDPESGTVTRDLNKSVLPQYL